MKLQNIIAWTILTVFLIFITYMGMHSWHQAYSVLFFVIVLGCIAAIILLFLLLRDVD